MISRSLRMRLLTLTAVAAAAAYFAFPIHKRINLGLDLKGGMHLVIKVETEKLPPETRQDAVNRAIEILRNRIDGLGVAEPVIQRQGEDQILVQLPGVTDRDAAVKMIGQVAELTFHLVVDDPEILQKALAEGKLSDDIALKFTKDDKSPILIKKEPVLRGEAVADARVDFNTGAFNQPRISLSFNSKGAKAFATITKEHVGERLAIVLDGQVLSAPTIQEPILSGRAEINGRFTFEEASLLALALRSGSLPAPMHIEEERTVGPLLGKDSIRAGIRATVFGAISVFLFMIFYYRIAGIVSCVALAMNLLIILGTLGLLNTLLPDAQVTLTLPGIAGIILTLGMAVDANVLINERIREELEAGRPLLSAINAGFKKAFSAIVDSNSTTLIAAFMLFQFGSGPIKGFAVTLTIGLLSSLFTSVFVTRTLLLVLTELKWIKGLSMMRLLAHPHFDFIGKRRICYALSLILVVGGMVLFFQKGDKAYGIDFAGGQIQEYRFEKPIASDTLRQLFKQAELNDIVIQRFEDDPRQVLLRSSGDTFDRVRAVFDQHLKDNPYTVLRIERVGPVVGHALRRAALLAILTALGGILLYIGFRFKHFDFATAGVIALLHDVVVTLGLVTALGRQVDLLVVTALLTIAGYSINDTIIIYDRVRENLRLMRRADLAAVLNTSINQTLSRTLLTTLTTFMVVVCLYLFGGEVLNTFALTLIIGFVAGTYSTVFIAAPLVLAWQKKRPQR